MADNSQNSPMSHLPKREGASAAPAPKLPQQPASINLPKKAAAAPSPALPSFLQTKSKPAPAAKNKSEAKPSKIGPIFWTITSVISLTVNVVVLVVLLAVLAMLQKQKIDVISLLPNLLEGLHSNFVKMDEAHITKTIPVSAQIPVKFDLQLNQQTNVVLSENVLITNALVTVNTGGLNITRAAANIVLPQGTTLPVYLNLTVPVDTSIPVNLNVAVDIPLNETQLHEPFVGLQNVVKPLYCLVKPNATNSANMAICP
jgi:hypothetical protein